MAATILIVEDHDAVRRSLRDWLEVEFPQFRVVEAASGEEATILTVVESPRLVIMDIALPGMNGIEATRRIKATSPSTQIVILTIHESNSYRDDATACGASAFVPKRMMQSELIPKLAVLLANDHNGGSCGAAEDLEDEAQ